MKTEKQSNQPDTAQFRQGVPPAPNWLSKDARAEYNRAAREIELAENALQQIDLGALASYAQAYADVARLTVEIRVDGEIVVLPNGISCENAKLTTLARAQRVLMQSITKLGFSPADRARMPKASLAKKTRTNAFDAFVK